MTDNEIIRILPTLPPHEVLKAAMECPELHPSFISFKRVSVETGQTEWQEIMTPEDFAAALPTAQTMMPESISTAATITATTEAVRIFILQSTSF